jgi:hypothetical protein
MAGWNVTPLMAPLRPQNSSGPSTPPKTPDESTWGFPFPSHTHLNRRVPTRNEELPRPQRYSRDFRNVLRKEHAAGGRLPLANTRRRRGQLSLPINGLFNRGQRNPSGDVFAAPLAHSPHRGLLRIFVRLDTDWRRAFSDLGRCDPAFAKHASFVIARSDSDEAIQSLSDLLDCFASLAMRPNHPL